MGKVLSDKRVKGIVVEMALGRIWYRSRAWTAWT